MLQVGRVSAPLVTLFLMGASIAAGSAAAQAPGLVAAYGFEEVGGTAVLDASGQGNGGTLSAALRVAGRFGNSLAFDGSQSLVTVPDSPSLDLTTGMTLEAWVYPTIATTNWRDVVYKGPDDLYYLMGSSSNGAPATGGTFAPVLQGSAALPVNTWSHLAATYDGAQLRLYVNGALVASRAEPGVIATSSGVLTLGGDLLYGQRWQGRIDEVRIYNRALSAAEIVSDLNTAVSSTPPSDTTPPTVSILSPSAGAAVTQVIQLSATAADNIGVLSVEFRVDGSSIGADTTSPYALSWNTTTVANGSHTLTAVARDTAGNQTTSTSVGVSVTNIGFVNEIVVPDITAATTIAFLPDGRMLVGELTETIWVVQPGANAPDPTPFLQLDGSQLGTEQGLMDLVLDPNFAVNSRYYIFHTRGLPNGLYNRVSRFTAAGNQTLPGSEVVLWQDDFVAEGAHHGGAMAFGNDGKLYFTHGDHFFPERAQLLTSYRGKVLRINPDGTTPTDNPFYDGAGPNKDQIWARGLRNPFRMSIDPVTGRMYIGDVGGASAASSFEEINLGAAGANYGWPMCEGSCAIAGVTSPVFAYARTTEASVVGGVVYRGNQFPPEYVGNYFYGDYTQNWIKRLILNPNGTVAAGLNFLPSDGSIDSPLVGDPVKFLVGPDGSLYYVDLGFTLQGEQNPAAVRRIRYAGNDLPPVAQVSANPTAGPAPLQVSFSSTGSFDPEGASLSYQWSFGDGASSTAANPVHTYDEDGAYIARLSLFDGTSTTLSSDLNISVGSPPLPTILGPQDGSTFRAGDVITFSGGASDPDEGGLGLDALSWDIIFRHEGHIHPVAGPLNGIDTGNLPIATTGHDYQGNTRYEIILTATDATGLSASTSVTIFPEKVDLTFDTLPSGLAVEIDGSPRQTPLVVESLVGFEHTIHAPYQTAGAAGPSFQFVSWSDAGEQSHTLVTPASDESYVAMFATVGVVSGGCGLGPELVLIVPMLMWLRRRL